MIKKSLSTLFLLALLCHSVYGQKLAQSFKVIFDKSFRPKLIVQLLNKLSKQVSDTVYQFQFADMCGWQDDSVSRSLPAQSTTTLKRNINLKQGYRITDSLLIPIPDTDPKNEPMIRIMMMRYTDATIDKSLGNK